MTETTNNNSTPLWKRIGYTLLTAFLGAMVTLTAFNIEHGDNVAVSGGSKRGIKMLIIFAAEKLGLIGSIIATVVAVGIAVYFNFIKKEK